MVETNLLRTLITGEQRISRFHDEKGNFVDFGGARYAFPAFISALAKRLFGYRPPVPMISYRGRQAIEKILRPDSRMVEFGSGQSTLWFAVRVGNLLSIEDDAGWFAHVQRELATRSIPNVRHELRTVDTYADLSSIENGSLDFALVDGRDRAACIHAILPKLKVGGWLYLDNSDKDMTRPDGDLRRAEAELRQAVADRDGRILSFSDFSPTNFFVEQGMLAQL